MECELDELRAFESRVSHCRAGCRAGDYELPPATTILCQLRQLARANHVACVSQKVLNVTEKQGSLPSWFSLPMWWNIQCVLLAWLIIRHPDEYIKYIKSYRNNSDWSFSIQTPLKSYSPEN